MANPRDVLGPYPFRGLRDEPARYGDARLAENVEWVGDTSSSVMRGRCGMSLLREVTGFIDRVALCQEWRGRTNDPLLVTVFNPAGASSYSIQVARGDEAPLVVFAVAWPAGRPSLIGFQQDAVLLVPASADGSPYTMWTILRHAPYLAPVLPAIPAASPNNDPGEYRGPLDPMRAVLGCAYQSRLFVVQDEAPWEIWYSNLQDITAWAYSSYVDPFDDDQSPITAMLVFAGALWVFTQSKIARVQFFGPGNIQKDILKTNTGCIGPAVQAGENLVFIGEDGLLELDQAGTVSETEMCKALRRTLRNLQGSLGDATLRYFASRRQLWLCIPATRRVFVFDYRSQNWATYDFGTRPDALGSYMNGSGVEQPIVGAVTRNAEGFVLRPDTSRWTDYAGALSVPNAYEWRWLSHSAPMLGYDLHRLFSHCWLNLLERAPGSLDVFWLVEGQAAGSNLSLVDQSYTIAAAQSPEAGPRAGTAVAGTGRVAPDLGETEWEAKVTLSGRQRGRWMQLGLRGPATSPGAVGARLWRLVTKVHTSPRER